jgi:hypothetical protein
MRKQKNIARLSITALALASLMSSVALMPVRGARAQTTGGSWAFTGSLGAARQGHTATLLKSGKVLVAGGIGAGFLSSAELYDPATGTWSYTGNLNKPRSFCTSTPLPDGKVLVVGGFTNNNPPDFGITNTAELYDPSSGTWSLTGNLADDRAWHSATLLRSGKVLVAGGTATANSIITNTVELWDPVTGTWTTTGSLGTARYSHTATLLRDGNVLIAGGTDDGDIFTTLASVELYDPGAGTWTSSGSLGTGRILHTATLLPGGKVLVSGGYMRDGGPPASLSSAELYDPATRNWSYTGTLKGARDSHTATLLTNGQVLVAGGFDWNRRVNLTSAELYDLSTGSWTSAADLNTSRNNHSATLLLNGKVLVAGGRGLGSAELYDPGTSPVSNPIDGAQSFVRQHYRDFLNREPDAQGLAYWTNEITSCGSDPECIDAKRMNVSAAYFLSIEFQQTGYLVYRTYKASYGNPQDAPVPLKFNELLPDTQQIGEGVIVNQTGWQQLLENNKQNFFSGFVQRARFTSSYPTSLTPDQFVDQLFLNAGVAPSATDRAAAINEFGAAMTTGDVTARARALRRVAENSTLAQQEFNRAFVLMQYFGYLRRNPNDPPDFDFGGFTFWLNKLEQYGNYIDAEMVKSFLVSIEYRQRFAL